MKLREVIVNLHTRVVPLHFTLLMHLILVASLVYAVLNKQADVVIVECQSVEEQ